MENFSRILVALDLSPMDHLLIQQAHRIAGLFRSSRVYFVHIVPDMVLPKSAQLEFRKRFAPETPIDEQVKNQLELTVREYWDRAHPTEWSVEVIEGKPYSQLLHWLELKKIDWLLIGQKLDKRGSGITARKLANHASCSVLFVPEKPLREGSNLLVPVDFSEDSARALKLAIAWRFRQKKVRITALHITDLLAAGYYLNRQDFENFNRFLSDTAKESFRKFLEEHQILPDAIEEVLLRNEKGSISERIIEYAATKKVDWILVGAQGHGAIGRFFFGSVTEKLVSHSLPTPILIVR